MREHELATSHYMATPEHFLWHARQAEADRLGGRLPLGGHRRREVGVGLQPRHHEPRRHDAHRGGAARRSSSCRSIRPTASTPPTTPPIVLTGDWIDQNEAEAAADFIRFAGTAQGQADRPRVRLPRPERRPRRRVADGRPTSPADPAGALALPEQDVVAAVNAAFPEVRKRANVLFLVDVSGSMDEPISASETKLTAAKDAIALALDHFTAGDNVGLAAFAQDAGRRDGAR